MILTRMGEGAGLGHQKFIHAICWQVSSNGFLRELAAFLAALL